MTGRVTALYRQVFGYPGPALGLSSRLPADSGSVIGRAARTFARGRP